MIDHVAIVEDTFKKYSPIQTKQELIEAMKIVEELYPKRIVELGVYRGGTLYPWSMCATEDAIIVGIDTPGTPPEVENNLKSWLKPNQRGMILLADTRSPATQQTVSSYLGDKIDFLFIDADHRYDWVKADYETWRPFVRSGGLIGFHDVHDDIIHSDGSGDSKKFFAEIRQQYKKSDMIYYPTPGHGIGLLWAE